MPDTPVFQVERGCDAARAGVGCGCTGHCHELIDVVLAEDYWRVVGERDEARRRQEEAWTCKSAPFCPPDGCHRVDCCVDRPQWLPSLPAHRPTGWAVANGRTAPSSPTGAVEARGEAVKVVPKLECECDPTGTGPHLIGCPLFVQGQYAQADLIDAIHGLDAYRKALEEIRKVAGAVCPEYEVCTHPACQASFSAWAIAAVALREKPDA